jgi:hypothetical protein
MPDLDHLFVAGYVEGQDFRSPLSVRAKSPPDRDRNNHGNRLLIQLERMATEIERLRQLRAASGTPEHQGVAIALEISPPGTLDPGKQLEWKRDGIEVLSVVDAPNAEIINVYVPPGKLGAFERRVREYLTKENAPRKEGQEPQPKNARLINAISSIRRAAFAELWTDKDAPPDREQAMVFQIWLRLGTEAPNQTYTAFKEAAQRLEVVVEPGYLTFPGRVVVAARSTRAALEQAIDLLDFVAEIRKTSLPAEFFLSDLRPFEQAEWVRDMAGRTEVAPADQNPPRVALLDTGVNRGHPLLSPLLDPADLHAVLGTWDTADHRGHGSEMAGLTLYGDLRAPLASRDSHSVPHRLESVKILPDAGANLPHLYGWTCDEAVRLVEQVRADATRTFSMMTTVIGATAGWPSEWSATIDRLAFGLRGASADSLDLPTMDGDTPRIHPRLFVVAAGNIPWPQWVARPGQNDLEAIEDPGQAWNALTVGAHTDLIEFDHDKWPDLQPIASPGSLSPSSRTSLMWPDRWPVKPDVVAEGGNGCIDGAATPQVTVGPEDLRLVTTSHEPARTLLAESGDTSAAAAEVARICAHLQSRYPTYWPETIRALVVQGAGYTQAMRSDQGIVPTYADRRTLLRRYGHGRVSMESSLNSALYRPTIIQQETIVPYVLEGSTYRLGQMNAHNLPWPKAELERLAEAEVFLKITLSYFIQPNPSRRGWHSKFRYQSHGLRFAVRGASETEERFHQRINGIKRDEMGDDREESMPDPDNEGWLLRRTLRSQGSLHSDTWYGLASELANKSGIVVFPVGGWWKEMAGRTQPNRRVRYSLVLSLDVSANADVDIYTPIANQIVVPVDLA